MLRDWDAWMPLVILPAAVLLAFPSDSPKWGLMWSLALAIYAGCKWLSWRGAPRPRAPLWKHLGYLLAWPGLDAATFLKPRSSPGFRQCSPDEWLCGIGKFILGLATFFLLARRAPSDEPLVAGWIGMIGIVMTLHFGLFHLLSCAWRSLGVDARPLMNAPLISTSFSEFWGRRWNTAFRDITNRFLFRPLATACGATLALVASFVASGLVHDLVISAPAGAGHGGPTAFFSLQGLAVLVSRSRLGKRLGLQSGLRGRLFAAAALLVPLGLLFHSAFVLEIVLPFMNAMGALECPTGCLN